MFQADQVQPIITTTDDSGDDCDYQHKPRCRIHALDCRIRPGEATKAVATSGLLRLQWTCNRNPSCEQMESITRTPTRLSPSATIAHRLSPTGMAAAAAVPCVLYQVKTWARAFPAVLRWSSTLQLMLGGTTGLLLWRCYVQVVPQLGGKQC